MPSINTILNWTFDRDQNLQSAVHVISHRTEYKLNQCLRQLVKLSADDDYAEELEGQEDRIYTAINLFYQTAPLGADRLDAAFTRRSVRYLCHGLLLIHPDYERSVFYSVFQDDLLQFFNRRSSDRVILILHRLLLTNWLMLESNPSDFVTLLKFCKESLDRYAGKMKTITRLKYTTRFFYSLGGPKVLAYELKAAKISLEKSAVFLNEKNAFFGTQYFERLLENYVREGDKFHDIEILSQILAATASCNSEAIKLLVVSRLIRGLKNQQLRMLMIREATKIVGKPTVKKRWQHSSLSEQENAYAEAARKQLNHWINRELIYVFFEEVIDDPERRQYWTGLVDDIEEVICCGSRHIQQQLRKNPQIGNFVEDHFKIVYRTSSTCAIVMYIKQHVFVEFSDTGALYIYRQNTFKRHFRLNNLSSTSDLKMTHLPLALGVSGAYYSGYQDEGRITHQGNWVPKLQHWMNRCYG